MFKVIDIAKDMLEEKVKLKEYKIEGINNTFSV